jgi:hypothetical protein
MKHTRIIRIAATCLALGAVAAPAASARPDIGPAPVKHQATQTHACGVDYSMNSAGGAYCGPAAKTAPRPDVAVLHDSIPTQPAFGVDMRSPDARDAARGVYPHSGVPAVATASKSDDTDWGKIGIIGGSVLGGLMLLGLGFVLFTRRTPALER